MFEKSRLSPLLLSEMYDILLLSPRSKVGVLPGDGEGLFKLDLPADIAPFISFSLSLSFYLYLTTVI